jgi:hypothetical protein
MKTSTWTLREVKTKGIFESCRSLPRQVEVFPVPPLKRTAIWIDWRYILFENLAPIAESSTNNDLGDIIPKSFQCLLCIRKIRQQATRGI